MQDNAFLSNLITEDIYVIKESAPNTVSNDSITEKIVIEQVEENIVQEAKLTYTQPLPTEGNNLKHCMVIVESTETILDTASKIFLENILKSVKRSPDDILLVNAKDANPDQIQALTTEQNHRHLLCFDSDKIDVLKNIENYTVHKAQHKFYLKADALILISKNIDKKKALWIALQEMFL